MQDATSLDQQITALKAEAGSQAAQDCAAYMVALARAMIAGEIDFTEAGQEAGAAWCMLAEQKTAGRPSAEDCSAVAGFMVVEPMCYTRGRPTLYRVEYRESAPARDSSY